MDTPKLCYSVPVAKLGDFYGTPQVFMDREEAVKQAAYNGYGSESVYECEFCTVAQVHPSHMAVRINGQVTVKLKTANDLQGTPKNMTVGWGFTERAAFEDLLAKEGAIKSAVLGTEKVLA